MDKELIELAALFKKRENKEYDGFLIGKVISPLPSIQISIDENIILDNSHLIVTERAFSSPLEEGNEVALLPSSNNQIYLLIDKVVTT